jgi:AraC-like DNA-binding protein
MKTELEHILPKPGSSFSLSVNPNFSDLFYWHFHPELEIVFIDGADGNRMVGQHNSAFEKNDLVMIGSYIPHLNFDYGIRTPYEKVVIHIGKEFLKNAEENTPEFNPMANLFKQSRRGIAFGEETKKEIGPRIMNLANLKDLEQFMELLSILYALERAEDKEFLHEKEVKNQYTSRDQSRLDRIYSFVDQNYTRRIRIEEIADLSHLSPAAFCRYFKKMTRLTFTQFVNHYRIDKAKKMLLSGESVTTTCYACGFESLSYFNRTFKQITGRIPSSFSIINSPDRN